MPGIQLPIGIETVNAVDADYKRGPWASIATAKAGIALALRYNNLSFYVVGDPNEYYWLDTDLSDTGLLTRSTGGAPTVSITKAALAALISGSTVGIGTTYLITDAQDALSGTISVLGVAVNRINGNGKWSFLGKLPAQGKFKFQTGTSGSVNQISVVMPSGTINLMTASVPYTTSRNNTAALVVADINANSAVSGCRAFVITSTTSGANFDKPTIIIEAIETSNSFVHTMVVSLTTLTINGQVNPTLGATANNLILDSFYDLTNDRILYANDNSKKCFIINNLARITALGYNPVTTFRWNDVRFENISLVDSGYRNCYFTHSLTTLWRTVNFTNSTVSEAMFSNAASANFNLLSGSAITNINASSGLSLNGSSSLFTVTSVECTTFSLTFHTTGNITVTNSTSTAGISVINNSGPISISTCAFNAATTITNNTVNIFTLLNINASTFSAAVVISGNRIFKGLVLSASLTFAGVNIQECEMYGHFNLTGNTHSGTITIARSKFNSNSESVTKNAFYISSSTLSAINISDSEVSIDWDIVVISLTLFDIDNSKISPTSFIGGITGTLNLLNSEIDRTQIANGGTFTDLQLTNSKINNCVINLVTSDCILVTSELENCLLDSTSVILIKSQIEGLTSADDLDLNNTHVKNNIASIKYFQDFLATPLVVASPVVISRALHGFFKDNLTITAWSALGDPGPPSSIQVGLNGGADYFSSTSVALNAATTLSNSSIGSSPVVTATDDITIASTGSNITSGRISLTITGKLLTDN